jgi:hypothetical protein
VYSATPTLGILAYNENLTLDIKFITSNTGASTINIDSLGAKSLKKQTVAGKIALTTGDIIANNIYTIVYDGTDFILVNPSNILAFDGAYKTLLTNSTNNNITWGDSLQSLMTAQGMIPYAATPNTPAMLTKGTSYQGLRMNSGETTPEWGNVMLGEKQIFTSSGTFTAPKTGIYKVICTGGGGGGSDGDSRYCYAGGGGGTAIKWVSLTKNDEITVTVGAGGSKGDGGGGAGSTGATSSFGASCSATGGAGGAYSASGTSEGGGGNGGAGSSGDINLYGGQGIGGYYNGTTKMRSWGGSSWWGGGHHSETRQFGNGGYATYAGASGIVTVEW